MTAWRSTDVCPAGAGVRFGDDTEEKKSRSLNTRSESSVRPSAPSITERVKAMTPAVGKFTPVGSKRTLF